VSVYDGSCCEGHEDHDDGDQGRDDVSDMRWTICVYNNIYD
jgi:hypothetical protein